MQSEIVGDYDRAWPQAFDVARQLVKSRLGPMIEGIEHIGSTSVRGLAAKPLIDIMVAVPSEPVQICIDALVELGYQRHRDGDFAGRVFLCPIDSQGNATHHLSITEPGGAYWGDQLAFRNALRADRDLAAPLRSVEASGVGEAWPRLGIYAREDCLRTRSAFPSGPSGRKRWASESQQQPNV
jgi:GrpB-like predicted nucleotidyltransferase (UPF0157 family)